MSSNRSSIRVSILGFLMIALTCLTIVAGTTWSANLFADRGDFAVSAARTTGNDILIPLFAPDDDKTTALRVAGIAASGRIAFSSDRILGIQKIFTIGGDGVGLTCLMCPGSSDASGTGTADTSTGTTPAVSPDGKTIAFVRSGQIWLMNTDGSGQPANTNVTGSNPQWSYDGTKLVFHRNINASGAPNNEIFVVNRNGTGEVNITNNAGNDVFPSWGAPVANHPEGRISFRSSRTGDSEIFVISPLTPNAPITNVTNNPAFDSSAKWSPDGTKLVFYSYRDAPNGEIYTLNPDTAAVARLTNDSLADSFPAWSPDGIKIVFMRHTTSTQAGNYELFTVDPIPANPLIPPGNLTNHPSADLDPSWGAVTTVSNGKIAFEAFSSGAGVTQIYTIADEVGATPALCGAGETREGHRPAYSHDGTKLAFMRGGTIWVANADCSSQVSTGAAGDAPTWSPDGTKIAFVRGSPFSDVWTMNIDGSSQTRRTNSAAQTNPAGSFSNGQPSWGSNDKIVFRGLSSKLVGGVSQSVGDIWTMEPAGTSFVRLTDDPINAYAPDWSPDATKIVFISNRATNRGELYIMNSAGAGQTRITNDASISNGNPAWSPDGTKIVHDDDFSRITRRDSLGTNGAVLTTGTFPDWQATSSSSTAQADVRITSIGDTPDPAVIGQTVYYQTQLFNAGPSPATGVKLTTDPLPTGVDYSNQSPAYCVFGANRVVTCTLPNGLGTNGLDNSLRVDIAVTVRQPDTINFKARVTANEQDPTLANNEATATTSVLSSSDLALDVTGPTQATVDTNVTYSMVVTNNGPDPGFGARAEFNMPTGVDFVSAEPASFNCTSTDISGGTKVTCTLGNVTGTLIPKITVRPRVVGPLQVGGQVFVTGSRDTVPGNDADAHQTTIIDGPRADLALSVLYSPNIINNAVRVGEEYSVYFTTTNLGPATATNAILIFTTATGVENVPGSTDSRCNTATDAGQTLFVCSLGNLANGASVSQLRIALKALAQGPRTDRASVTANEADPTGNCIDSPNSNNCVTTGGNINGPRVDLEPLVTNPAQIFLGENVEFNIRVKNHGPSPATNVVVDMRHIGSLLVAVNHPGCAASGIARVRCSLGAIGTGETSSLVVIAVKPTSAGPQTLDGSVTAAEPEPNPDPHPNSFNVVTTVTPKFELKGLEVTQGVQDLANSVPLIRGKRTYVRAYLKTLGGSAIVTPELVGYRNTAGGLIPLGTLPMSNVGKTEVYVDTNPDRDNFEANPYFYLPENWTTDESYMFELRLKGNPGPLLCSEPDESSNCKAVVNLRNPTELPVEIVNLTYTFAGTNYSPTKQERNLAIYQINALFPIRTLSWTEKSITLTPDIRPSTVADFQAILNVLTARRILDCPAANCTKPYLGVMAPAPSLIAPGSPGYVAGLAENPGKSGATYSLPIATDGVVAAHEMGHLIGLNHTAYTAGPGGAAENTVPHQPSNGTISVTKGDFDAETIYGFDVYNFNQYDTATPQNTQRVFGPDTPNFMSYASARKWASELDYKRLLSFIEGNGGIATTGPNGSNAPLTAEADEFIMVSGLVPLLPGGTANLQPVYRINSPRTVALPSPGSHEIWLEGPQGQPLATHSFAPETGPGGPEAVTGGFSFALPWTVGTTRISVRKNGQVVATQQASANAPQVNIVSPNGGETLGGSTTQVQWTASDADPGATLKYILQFSPDGGTTWSTLVTDATTTNYPLELRNLTGTTNGLFRVFASDGFNTSSDVSNAPFTVPPHAPDVSISGIENNQIFVADQMIVLNGNAYDVEDGLISNPNLTWSSNRNGLLGSGGSLSVAASSLQEGTHIITLTGTDSNNQTGTASISIVVSRTPPVLPPTLSLGLSQMFFSSPFGATPVAPQALTITNSGSGDLTWSATADSPWIALDTPTGTAPAATNVSINAVNLTPGTYSGVVTIAASGASTPQAVNVYLAITAGAPSTIGGRVLTPTGLGIRNAIVSLVNSQGVSRTATTSSFGVFSFADVADDYYLVRISSKRYRFAARSVQIFNDFTLTDFVGLE